MDDTKTPELGDGPYEILRCDETGFYYIIDGREFVKRPVDQDALWGYISTADPQPRAYPLAKTAYRACRQANAAGGFPRLGEEIAQVKALLPEPFPGPAEKAVQESFNEALAELEPAEPDPPKPVRVNAPTREQWLNDFTTEAREVFKQHDLTIPDKVRVSVGFMFRSPKAIGQCWHESASKDGTREIFINPTLDDSSRVADVLTHELCHTLFGPDEKHGKNFKAAAYGMGLTGKATATEAGPEWHAWADPILERLGPIPHAALDPQLSGTKKQTTRLLKCECEDCGFTFRATAKWVNGRVLSCPDADCQGPVTVGGE